VYADRLTVQPRAGGPTLVVHNDSAETWAVTLDVSRASTADAGVLTRETVEVQVAARGSATVALAPATVEPTVSTAEFLAVRADGVAPAFWYFHEDTELSLAPPAEALTARARRTDGGYDVEVEAHALVKDLCLFPDRLDAAARVDTGLVTLTAGEHHTFVVTSGALDETALVRRPVLRCVNDLLRPSA
jgi:beta-mannosidase